MYLYFRNGEDCALRLVNLVHLHNHAGNFSPRAGLSTAGKHHNDFIDCYTHRRTRFDLLRNPLQQQKDR